MTRPGTRSVGMWGLAAMTLTGCTGLSPAGPVPQTRPVVLVHGSWMGAAAWDRVAGELKRQGVAVTAVELPGHGSDPTPASELSLDAYVTAVQAALPQSGQATVVGHSMGGMVISALAEKDPARVANLVFVAAYLPQDGDSLYKLAMTDKASQVGRFWTQSDPKAYTPATIRAEGIAEVFCADCSKADQQWLIDRHRPEAVPPLGTPVRLTPARFGTVPRVYVHTRQDKAVSYDLQRAMLAAAGGAQQVHSLDTSHSPMLTQPEALAALIAQAARVQP